MARLLAILFIFISSWVMACDMDIEKPSACTERDICSEEMRDYLWQDKSQEIEMNVEELGEDFQYAISSQDWVMLKKYLKFPVALYIEDKPNNLEKHYTLRNIEELAYIIKSFADNNPKISQYIKYNKFRPSYIPYSTYVWLSSSHISLGIDIKCDSFIPNQYQEYPVLPDDIATCNATQMVIEHISLKSN